MSGFSEYDQYDALGLAGLVRDREVTPLELVDEAVTRIDRVNPRLNAVVTRMYDHARERAKGELPKGPFTGVPFLVKDLLSAYAGFPLSAGSRFYDDYVPDYDAELIVRHKSAGLITVGKTNTPELGIVAFTEPERHGPTHTPWKIGHTSGGSSGGAGSAVGAGVVPMAHGGDGGGSIRIPASCCGVFGLKPTRGRTPTGPDASEQWRGFAIEHALTRSVRDSAALLDATTGPEVDSWYQTMPPAKSFLDQVSRKKKLGKLKIGVTKTPHLPGGTHSDCADAVDDVAALCADLGHTVDEVDLGIDPRDFAHDFVRMIAVSTAAGIDEAEAKVGRAPHRKHFETETWLTYLMGQQVKAVDYEMSFHRLQAMARRIHRFYQDWDVVLSPTLGMPPVRIGQLRAVGIEAVLQETVASTNLGLVLRVPGLVDQLADKIFEFVPFTPLANVTGQPSMSVPLCWNDAGLPIGTMFTGGFGEDTTLLRLAAQLEKARPWAERRPPVWSGPAD